MTSNSKKQCTKGNSGCDCKPVGEKCPKHEHAPDYDEGGGGNKEKCKWVCEYQVIISALKITTNKFRSTLGRMWRANGMLEGGGPDEEFSARFAALPKFKEESFCKSWGGAR